MDTTTVQDVATGALQDVAQNNPVPDLNTRQPLRPVDDMTLWQAKRTREANTTSLDYAKAALHQDGFLDGFIGNMVGADMKPDPNFNVLQPDVWKNVTQGIPEDLHGELLDSHSYAHAMYTRDRILQKMQEQTILGDLGWKGNTMRLVGGFVSPENLALMAGTMGMGAIVGGGTALARASRALQLTTEMAEGPARVAAVAKATAELQAAAAEQSTARAAAGQLAFGGGANAGLEALRQRYNFEDDPGSIIHAGMTGVVLASPFAWLHAREMARLRETTGHELDMLNTIQAANKFPDAAQPGHEATAEKVAAQHKYMAEVVDGEKEIGQIKQPESAVEGEYLGKQEKLPNQPRLLEHWDTLEGVAKRVEEPIELPPAEPKKLTGPEGEVEAPEEYAPEGFQPGSLSAAAATGSIHQGIAPTYMRNGRLDIYATLNRNPNKVIQELAHVLIKDPIANSATEAQGWTASELKRNMQRTLGGYFHTEAQAALSSAVQKRGVNIAQRKAFAEEFYRAVTRVTRGDPDILSRYADIAPELQRAAAAQKSVYKQMIERAQRAEVQGAMGVSPNDTYVNRIFDFGNIRSLIEKHGEEPVYRMLSNAMPWLSGQNALVAGNVTKRVTPTAFEKMNAAKAYLHAVRKLEYSHMSQDIQLYAHDMNALRTELRRGNLTEGEINSIVDAMFEHKATSPDAGNTPNLKYRFKLDENYGERMSNGDFVKVADLFENDSRVLVDRYLNSMAGHTALAEKGIKSRADFAAWMKDAEDEHAASSNDVHQYNRGKQLLEDMYSHITGRPMSTQTFNTTDRIANSLRAWTRANVLGQLGVAAAFELSKAMIMAGFRSALTQMPTLMSMMRAVRSGHQFDAGLARDIRTLWGFGSESASGYARQHELTDFSYDRALTRFENWGNEASHVVDHLSGNAFFTAATREMSARFAVQRYADFAFGRRSLSEKMRSRMVGNGVDRSLIDPMLRDMKQYVERDGDRVTGIRYEDWQRDNPVSFENFQRVVERDVRDWIQEHDIGETMPWMHSTLGKVFSELRTFMLVGHAKNTLKALHYRDATSLNQLMFGIVSEAMAYSLQTSINFAQNPRELQRRMDPTYMAQSIFQRMSLMGMLPWLAEPVSKLAGVPMQGSTVNTDNRNFILTPSMNNVLNLLTSTQVAGQALNPLSNTVTTDKEMRTAMQAFPGGNLWVMRNIADWMAQGHPRQELRQ